MHILHLFPINFNVQHYIHTYVLHLAQVLSMEQNQILELVWESLH